MAYAIFDVNASFQIDLPDQTPTSIELARERVKVLMDDAAAAVEEGTLCFEYPENLPVKIFVESWEDDNDAVWDDEDDEIVLQDAEHYFTQQ